MSYQPLDRQDGRRHRSDAVAHVHDRPERRVGGLAVEEKLGFVDQMQVSKNWPGSRQRGLDGDSRQRGGQHR